MLTDGSFSLFRRVEQLMSRLNSKGPVVVEQKSKPGGKDNVTVSSGGL